MGRVRGGHWSGLTLTRSRWEQPEVCFRASGEHGVAGRKLRDWRGGQRENREGQFQDAPDPQTLHQRTLTFSPSGPAGPPSPSRPGSPWKVWWEKMGRHHWGGASCTFPSSPSLEQDPQP